MLLAETVNNVLLPTLSRIQDDASALRRWYLKTVDLTAFVTVIANTTLLVNAHWFLVTFLGKGTEKWLPAQAALQILCIYGILRAVTATLSPCLMACGETKPLWNANLLIAAVEIVLLLVAVRSGRIELVATAMLISLPCGTWGLLPFLRRGLSVELGDIAAQIWPVIPAMIVASIFTSLLPASLGGSMITLALRGLFTASVVALTHGLCTRFRCFQEASGMIWQNLQRMRA
jgi:O-antigen/teichoic acid export membrane protein